MERVSVNLHACAREELRDTAESIATSRATLSTADCVESLDSVTSASTVSTSMDAWACSALRASTISSKPFHGLPLNVVENCADSVGEVNLQL
jgi:hypothetical protein